MSLLGGNCSTSNLSEIGEKEVGREGAAPKQNDIGRSAYSHLCLQESDILYPSKGQYIKADCAAKLNSSRTMGCIKSKSPFPHTILDDGSREVGKYDSGCNLEKSSLIQANSGMSSSTNTAVLDFAHRLSLEILDQAVKQWAMNESKYSDIPFIESDEP